MRHFEQLASHRGDIIHEGGTFPFTHSLVHTSLKLVSWPFTRMYYLAMRHHARRL